MTQIVVIVRLNSGFPSHRNDAVLKFLALEKFNDMQLCAQVHLYNDRKEVKTCAYCNLGMRLTVHASSACPPVMKEPVH